ncbi:metallophosphoesterase family protein [Evansella sp. AB-P1]|uniref:metallophosphoesterase family protein n=1 Tax=Evansella sp. AB-P1 TaxID=3037653 RepID=UPI00241C1895|nr:metallophosphoesterase family protein [Evansella sp. AB-P1]MDG5786939.1 metallophosphoesterase family protein [Evansella sp. AB-P1]
MKIAFISDIHGNAIALDAVLQDIHNKNVDKIIVLGDISYRGPEPKRALDIIRSLKTDVIKGNADEWVVRGIKEGEVPEKAREMMTKERDWIVSKLDEQDLNYLKTLPKEHSIQLTDNISIQVFHATPNSLFEVVLPDEDAEEIKEKMMGQNDASIYLYGHIHQPYVRYIQGKVIANVGSVGLPFDGLPQASYMLVEEKEGQFNITNQRVKYDIEKVVKQYHDLAYPNATFMSQVIRNGSLN